jgi:hypothetical protein
MEISNKYINRLFEEWKQYGKIIIAVDFDDTISPWKLEGFSPEPVIAAIREAQITGAYVMIHTSCSSDRFGEITEFCSSKRIEVNAINTNPIPIPFGNTTGSKPYANIYLDDRAGLTEALEILKAAMYRYRGWKLENEFLPDVG